MSGCVRNIRTKNYQNLIIGFQVTAKNVGDVFFGTQCSKVSFIFIFSENENLVNFCITLNIVCKLATTVALSNTDLD